MKSLLVIACSNRKVRTDDLIPALERYDGGTYRVIRKLQRNNSFPGNVEVKIISAKFGLIDAHTPIPYYDQRINKQIADMLKSSVKKELEKCLSQTRYSEIYIDLGKDYTTTIEGVVFSPMVRLSIAKGKIGERLKSVKKWLNNQAGT